MFHPEQGLRPFDRQHLHLVDDLLTLVVPLARITLRVLVGEHVGGRVNHRTGHIVLAGNETDRAVLATTLLFDQPGDLRIGIGKSGVQGGRLGHPSSVEVRDAPHTRASLTSGVTGPCLSTTGLNPVTSTTVDGSPPGLDPSR